MSLDHTIILGRQRTSVGNGSFLKVTQGASVLVPVSQQYTNSTAIVSSRQVSKPMFTWNGNVFIPNGGRTSNNGWMGYHHGLDEFYLSAPYHPRMRLIPFYDRVLFWYTGIQGYGSSPWIAEYRTGTVSTYVDDYAIANDYCYLMAADGKLYTWQYPFNGSPTNQTMPTPGGTNYRLCELDNEIYMLNMQSGTPGTLRLYKNILGVLTLVGSGTSANIYPAATDRCGVAFFKFNGKLFVAFAETNTNQKVRLFEIDKSTGVFTERNSWLPAAWQAAAAQNYNVMTEIRDDISNTEQVFLLRTNGYQAAGWEIYEFAEGPFSAVHNGSDIIFPYGGAIYDPSTKAAQFESASDSSPSSYITAEIETYDLAANGTSDIDPRYRQSGAESPPYTQCTEKIGVGSEGVTGLSTKPTGITTLADLSDDFGDASIDEDLWEIVNYFVTTAARGYGSCVPMPPTAPVITEAGGEIRFGDTTSPVVYYPSVGLKSKWWMDGAFTIRLTLANLANLRTYSSIRYKLMFVVKVNTEQFYGVYLWRNTGGTNYVRSIYCAIDTNVAEGADATYNPVDGDVIEFSRDGADNWSIIIDPDGVAEDITPAGVNYSEPAHLYIGATSAWSLSWAVATPAPGLSDVAVSGAGTLDRYEGGVKHTYAWNHISDLGAGVTTNVQMFVDVQRT